MAKEIWFKCNKCGKEAYCDVYFEKIPEAEVIASVTFLAILLTIILQATSSVVSASAFFPLSQMVTLLAGLSSTVTSV